VNSVLSTSQNAVLRSQSRSLQAATHVGQSYGLDQRSQVWSLP